MIGTDEQDGLTIADSKQGGIEVEAEERGHEMNEEI